LKAIFHAVKDVFSYQLNDSFTASFHIALLSSFIPRQQPLVPTLLLELGENLSGTHVSKRTNVPPDFHQDALEPPQLSAKKTKSGSSVLFIINIHFRLYSIVTIIHI